MPKVSELDATTKAALVDAVFGSVVETNATVDTVEWGIAVTPATGKGGVALKLPGSGYGDTPYVDGEFPLALLEEGSGDATEATASGSVLWRLDHVGGSGQNGGIHVWLGGRKTTGATQAIWVQLAEDAAGVVVTSPASGGHTKAYLSCVDAADANAVRFAVNSAGQAVLDSDAASLSAPALTFAGETNTGLWLAAANTPQMVVNGAAITSWTASVFSVADGKNISFGQTTGTKIGVSTAQKLAFYGSTPIAKQTGVAVTAAGIHAALVNLGLIAA